jgi:photosystem II stability/assembly factor-like uncharacterized protein
MPLLNVESLASAPATPQRVYAATSRGLYRSVDSGKTWRRLAFQRRTYLVGVTVAPSRPSTVYVLNNDVLWRSTDGAETWKRVLTGDMLISVTVHPSRPNVVLAGMRGAILRSNEGGRTWEEPPPPPPAMWYTDPNEITFDPEQPWRVYVATGDQGFFRSRDGGRTWSGMGQELGLQWAHAVIVDQIQPSTLYVAGFDVTFGGGAYRSNDRGKTWQPIDGPGLSTTWITSAAVASDSSRIFVGTSASGLRTGGGVFWHALP